jgi:hypothetical protein
VRQREFRLDAIQIDLRLCDLADRFATMKHSAGRVRPRRSSKTDEPLRPHEDRDRRLQPVRVRPLLDLQIHAAVIDGRETVNEFREHYALRGRSETRRID